MREGEDPALAQWVSFLAQLYLVPLAAIDNLGVQQNTSWIDPKTLTPDQITLIKSLADRITKPAARVRLCEYLWLASGDHTCARQAVAAYLILAEQHLDPEEWIEPAAYFGRALRLAARLGRGTLFDEVTTAVDQVVRKLDGEDPLFLTTELMQALIDTRARVDPNIYAPIAEKAARRARTR